MVKGLLEEGGYDIGAVQPKDVRYALQNAKGRGVTAEELRNAKHVAVPEQLMDAGGVLLGIYFLADGLHRGAVINTVLGGIMAWIHGHRFIVGDQIDVRSLLR